MHVLCLMLKSEAKSLSNKERNLDHLLQPQNIFQDSSLPPILFSSLAMHKLQAFIMEVQNSQH